MMPAYRPPNWPTARFIRSGGTQAARRLGPAVVQQLADLNQRYERVGQVGRDLAQEAEDYAKRSAPWKDRTGEARRRLSVRFLNLGGAYVLRYAHGVYYGRFLEYRWGGRYAILRPAAAIYTNRLRDRLRRLFRRTVGAFSLRQVIDTSSAFDPRSGKQSTNPSLWK
jgi:hypothetical protein